MSRAKNRRHRHRYCQIASALARHGLGYLVGVVGLAERCHTLARNTLAAAA